MKLILKTLIITVLFGGCIFSVEEEKQDLSRKRKDAPTDVEQPSKKIKTDSFKELPYPKESTNSCKKIRVFGGKIEENREYIDIMAECPIAKATFKELIEDEDNERVKGVPFILVVATNKDAGKKDECSRYYFSVALLEGSFNVSQGIIRRDDYGKIKTYIENPINRQPIESFHFFSIHALDDEFKYLGDKSLLTQNSDESYWLRLYITAGLDREGKTLINFGDFCKKAGRVGLAEKAYEMAWGKGNVGAAAALGSLYYKQGKMDLAEELLKKAAEKGNVGAMAALGAMYAKQGKMDLAEEWLKKAVEKGHVVAAAALVILYSKQGKMDLAEELLKKIAEAGNVQAMRELGNFYLQKKEGNLSENRKLGEKWLINASDRGNVVAKIDLGDLFSGLVVASYKADKDSVVAQEGKQAYQTAKNYYKSAIEKGSRSESVFAMDKLASLYKLGGDLDSAKRHYQEAARAGFKKSYYHLGMIYKEKGDTKTAKEFFEKAGDDQDAKKELELLK